MSEAEQITHSRRVEDEEERVRLDVFLSQQPELGSRSVAKLLIKAGGVEVDGRVLKAGAYLKPGQEVRFSPGLLPPEETSPPASEWSQELKVLFEDPHMLVINKQIGIAAHRPSSHHSHEPNIADLATRHCGERLSIAAGEDRPGIVHRLDKDTTGVMVLAKTDEASHFLRSQFKARTTQKEYRAIAFGNPRFDSDYVERMIATHPRMGDRMTVVQEGGKAASTYYEVIERFAEHCYLRCLPKTGRTHQIRVHLMSIGHSIVGDRVYRSRNVRTGALPEAAPDPGRQCLHAMRLGIKHPRTHEDMSFEAPLPRDMEELLRWLRGG